MERSNLMGRISTWVKGLGVAGLITGMSYGLYTQNRAIKELNGAIE